MTIPTELAVGAVAFLGALVTVLGVLMGHLWSRLSTVETKLEKVRTHNRAMWEWARRHIDLYYRWRQSGAPDPDPIPQED